MKSDFVFPILDNTSGLIVYAVMQDGTLAWLYHEQDQ